MLMLAAMLRAPLIAFRVPALHDADFFSSLQGARRYAALAKGWRAEDAERQKIDADFWRMMRYNHSALCAFDFITRVTPR